MGNVSTVVEAVDTTKGLLTGTESIVNKDGIPRIVACGELLKMVTGPFSPEEKNPVMEKLNELESKIGQLSWKISNLFNDVKAFISEHHFYAEYAGTASMLMKSLQDVVAHPDHHRIGLFRDITLKHPPLEYGVKLISLMEQDATNPLKMAMNADWLKKKSTFDKWRNCINGVLGQFLYLECMVNGMFWDKNMIGPNQLADRIAGFNAMMEYWFWEYKKSYWPNAVRDLIHDTQDNYRHVGNEAKADILKDRLSEILTDDAFYIIVYNDCAGFDNHSFTYNADKFIDSFRRGGCNVVVYRSLQMNSSEAKEQVQEMEHKVEACRKHKLPRERDMKGVPGELGIPHTGFVGLIHKGRDVVIRSAKCWREHGPGWWITAETSVYNDHGSGSSWDHIKFILIAGYH